jgi:hypothetical protein
VPPDAAVDVAVIGPGLGRTVWASTRPSAHLEPGAYGWYLIDEGWPRLELAPI